MLFYIIYTFCQSLNSSGVTGVGCIDCLHLMINCSVFVPLIYHIYISYLFCNTVPNGHDNILLTVQIKPGQDFQSVVYVLARSVLFSV